jgi:hypothetical protein
VAIATSLALHLLLLALLFSSERAAPPRVETVAFDVELRPALPSVAPVEPAAPPRRPAGFHHLPDAKSSPMSPAARAESPATSGTPGAALDGLRALGLGGAPDLRVRGRDVVPGVDGSAEEGGDGIASGGAGDGAGGGPAATLPAPLTAWLREQAGRDRVESGRAHPYFLEVGRVLTVAWDAEASVERGLSNCVTVRVVRVTQAPDGRLLSVELVSPSDFGGIDRGAVAGVRAAAARLPAPPIDAREGRQTLVSLWEFELDVSTMPPLPFLKLEFDEVLGLGDIRLPGDRRIRKRLRLVAVM